MDPRTPLVPASAPRGPRNPGRPATFTTVGSIYNPQSATPLLPPIRRGRNLRWAQPNQSDPDPSSRSPFSPSNGQIQSPLSRAPLVVQEYSPLQQNYDRAVNPVMQNGVSGAANDTMGHQNLSDHRRHLPSTGEQNMADATTIDEQDIALLAGQFNVKTLTNLASYPNPNQKAAQKALARARPALLSSTNASRIERPTTPQAFSQPNPQNFPYPVQNRLQPDATSYNSQPNPQIFSYSVQSPLIHAATSYNSQPNPQFFSDSVQSRSMHDTTSYNSQPNPQVSSYSVQSPLMHGAASYNSQPNPQTFSYGVQSPLMYDTTSYNSQPNPQPAREISALVSCDGNIIPGRFLNNRSLPRESLQAHQRERVSYGIATGSGPFSGLSAGPGAPLPLTAGPPGQRQHSRPSVNAFVEAMDELEIIDNPTVETEYDFFDRPSLVDLYNMDPYELNQPQQMSPLPNSILHARQEDLPDVDSMDSDFAVHSEDEALPSIIEDSIRVHDTLLPEAIQQYYPAGLPADYNPRNVRELPLNWLRDYPIDYPGNPYLSEDDLVNRKSKLDKTFYAGTSRFYKSMEDIIAEAEDAKLARSVGVIGGERDHNRRQQQQEQQQREEDRYLLEGSAREDEGEKRRENTPFLSIEAANSQTITQHAEPLLRMAFGSLLEYVEDIGDMKYMGDFVTPEPSFIDDTDNGRKSHFEKIFGGD